MCSYQINFGSIWRHFVTHLVIPIAINYRITCYICRHNLLFTMIRLSLLFAVLATTYACSSASTQQEATVAESGYPTKGSIERLDSAINQIIPPGAQPEVLAEGFDWSEGPVWVPDGDYLLFSDVPTNSIYQRFHAARSYRC